jgi:hypothetical protein
LPSFLINRLQNVICLWMCLASIVRKDATCICMRPQAAIYTHTCTVDMQEHLILETLHI